MEMTKKVVPLTDLQIASHAKMQSIWNIAEKAGIPEEAVEPYGRFKAKIDGTKLPGHTTMVKLCL